MTFSKRPELRNKMIAVTKLLADDIANGAPIGAALNGFNAFVRACTIERDIARLMRETLREAKTMGGEFNEEHKFNRAMGELCDTIQELRDITREEYYAKKANADDK